MLNYKGYSGKVEFDNDAEILHGTVINTRAAIRFKGESIAKIKKAFKDAIDDYLDLCSEMNEEPEKPFSGRFVLRLTPEQHSYASLAAKTRKKSLNQWITDLIEGGIQDTLPNYVAAAKDDDDVEGDDGVNELDFN